jgi:hypothetical protein
VVFASAGTDLTLSEPLGPKVAHSTTQGFPFSLFVELIAHSARLSPSLALPPKLVYRQLFYGVCEKV